MNLNSLPGSDVQIIYLTISKDKDLTDSSSEHGRCWSQALDIVEQSAGFKALHWGRSVEYPTKTQLHIVRSSMQEHQRWLKSNKYDEFLHVLAPLVEDQDRPVVRHVECMTNYTSSPTSAFNAPVTGTAIYVRTTSAWHEGSWPCWTHVVRHVTGNSGISGGKLIETYKPKESQTLAGISVPQAKDASVDTDIDDCYLVYVGWDTIKAHNDYHHTKHFQAHGVILTVGNDGWREYGHIRFEGWRGGCDIVPDVKANKL